MKQKMRILTLFIICAMSSFDGQGQQETFIGEVKLFAGNFAPRGWSFCDGQLLAISQNTALFSVLGAQYGGDGRTSFALPDMRGRVAVGPRTGPGLSNYKLAQKGGVEYNSSNGNVLISNNNGANAATKTGRSIENRQPFLGLNYIICTNGSYPSRN